MKLNNIIARSLQFITLAMLFEACTDNIVVPENNNDDNSNTSTLDVVISLDNMGGATSRASSTLTDIENYINVETLRVLFFTCEEKANNNDYDHDYFLFEAKNHWIKQIEQGSNVNRWLISIPMYTHGNNTEGYNWNWELIRERLTTKPFKIAILANRPDYDYVDNFSGNEGQEIASGYMDNRGPKWGVEDAFGGSNPTKDVFDLQHCQYDINYRNKSTATGFYSFVMGDWGYENGKTWSSIYGDLSVEPKMGATISWVDWSMYNVNGFENSSKTPTQARHFKHPDYNNPIPMYGIQLFDAINPEFWPEGTPYYLSPGIPGEFNAGNYTQKTISLLRAAVKTELFIPKSAGNIEMVAVVYPNIYSRCDPMDVWTPTDELWNSQHTSPIAGSQPDCEINAIMSYGPLATSRDRNAEQTTSQEYQQRISWFYGVWKEKGWKFNDFRGTFAAETDSTKYPRIFNPAIQRNQLVICDENVRVDDNDDYYHYVVYCGERNVNDPSNLNNLGSESIGNATLQYWQVQIDGVAYAIPITDYGKRNNLAHRLTGVRVEDNYSIQSGGGTTPQYKTLPNGLKYMYNHQANGSQATTNGWYMLNNDYLISVRNPSMEPRNRPWPLLRNHVYSITLSTKREGNGSSSGLSRDGNATPPSFSVKCEDHHTKKF